MSPSVVPSSTTTTTTTTTGTTGESANEGIPRRRSHPDSKYVRTTSTCSSTTIRTTPPITSTVVLPQPHRTTSNGNTTKIPPYHYTSSNNGRQQQQHQQRASVVSTTSQQQHQHNHNSSNATQCFRLCYSCSRIIRCYRRCRCFRIDTENNVTENDDALHSNKKKKYYSSYRHSSTNASNTTTAILIRIGLLFIGIYTIVVCTWNVSFYNAYEGSVFQGDNRTTNTSPSFISVGGLLRHNNTKKSVSRKAAIVHDRPNEWKNEQYNVVHVIQTRFMQNQPHLVQLGLARLQLFKSITIPSIQHQTIQNFIWIIRIDPKLHTIIKQPLIQIIQQIPNAILVASNQNPEGFRDTTCIDDITEQSVLAGNIQLVRSYYNAGQTHVVLETRCDADDALAIDFVEMIQVNTALNIPELFQPTLTRASETTATITNSISGTGGEHNDSKDSSKHHHHHHHHHHGHGSQGRKGGSWIVYCANHHMEWQYDDPWLTSNETTTTTSSISNNATATNKEATKVQQRGALLVLKSGLCVTPGLTWGYSVNATRDDIPVSHHQKIQKLIPPCDDDENDADEDSTTTPTTTGTIATSTTATPKKRLNCLIKLGGDLPLALRARTPTSAGMDHVFVYNETESIFPMEQIQKSKSRILQNELWNVLDVIFGVSAQDLYEARTFIAQHFVNITRDALAGQCTKGHSCKSSSKELLQNLLNHHQQQQQQEQQR